MSKHMFTFNYKTIMKTNKYTEVLNKNYTFLTQNNYKIINLTKANLVLNVQNKNLNAFIITFDKTDFFASFTAFANLCLDDDTYLIYDETNSKNLNTSSPIYYGTIRSAYQLAKQELENTDFKPINFIKEVETKIKGNKPLNSYIHLVSTSEKHLILNLSLKYDNHIYYLDYLANDNIFLGLNNSNYYENEIHNYVINCKNTAFTNTIRSNISDYNNAINEINQKQQYSYGWANDDLLKFGDLSSDFNEYIRNIPVLQDNALLHDFALGLMYVVFKDVINKNPSKYNTEDKKRLLVSNLANNLKQRLKSTSIKR